VPVILPTQEAEIRRIMVGSQPGQIVHETLSQKTPSQKRAGGVAQGEGLEFKPQYSKKYVYVCVNWVYWCTTVILALGSKNKAYLICMKCIHVYIHSQ
jgi:hypothetical protein